MIRVPVDLTGEQKTVMAYFSIRQFMLIIPALAVTLIQLILFNIPFISGIWDFLLRLAFFLVVNAITVSLAFIPVHKYDVYLSEFLVNRFKFWVSQKVYRN